MLKPMRTVVQPDKEFKIEMIIGISAPLMGRMNKKPNIDDSIDKPMMYSIWFVWAKKMLIIIVIKMKKVVSLALVISFIDSWFFRRKYEAIDPEKVIKPEMMINKDNKELDIWDSISVIPIKPEAKPPNPFKIATIWGRFCIFIL